jgi:hypothetical protein
VDATRHVGTKRRRAAIELLPFGHRFVRRLGDIEHMLDDVGIGNVNAPNRHLAPVARPNSAADLVGFADP